MIKSATARLNSHSETCRACPADKKKRESKLQTREIQADHWIYLIRRKVFHECRFNILFAMYACMHAFHLNTYIIIIALKAITIIIGT